MNSQSPTSQTNTPPSQAVNGTDETLVSDASKNIVLHHLQSFQQNDLDAVVSDYTAESVLLTQTATYKGPGQIRDFFAALMPHFPVPGTSFELDRMVADGSLVYIVWHAATPSLRVPLGTDTFVMKEGKIFQQTFAGQLNFIAAV